MVVLIACEKKGFDNILTVCSCLLVAPSFVPRHNGIETSGKKLLSSQGDGSRNRRQGSGASGLHMMPIGVPKVAYRVPGSQQADW